MSYIICPASEVLAQAHKRIEEILATRQARDESAINYVMSSKKHFWSKKPYSREEAIEYLDNSDMFGWHSVYGWDTISRLRKLIVLASHGDPVMIDADDATALWD